MNPPKTKTKKPVMSITTTVMTVMVVTSVVSLRGLASQAEFGMSSIFYYLLAGTVFLVPFALVCAELASMFSVGSGAGGGVFTWVRQAWGPGTGWLAMFCEWWWVVVWYPPVLMFGAVALAYVAWPESFDHTLASSRVYVACFVLAVFWAATLNALRGIRGAARIGTWAGMLGTMLPAAVLIVMGVVYVCSPGTHIDMTQMRFLPRFDGIDSLVLAASIFLFFGGIEMQAVHVTGMRDPARQFPRAVFAAVAIILTIFIGGTLALATVVPQGQINLLQTMLAAYHRLWAWAGVPWLGNVLAALVTFGVVGQISLIIVSPTRGLANVGRQGYLSARLCRYNRHGVPTRLLLMQGVIVTVLVTVLTVLPTAQSAYQILGQLSSVIYLLMVICVYLSCLRLRRRHPEIKRPFKVPGGVAGIWIVCTIGLAGAVAALVLSFFPPDQIAVGSSTVYVWLLLGATAVSMAIAWLMYRRPKPGVAAPQSVR